MHQFSAAAKPDPLQGASILVVEDDRHLDMFFQDLLEAEGFRVAIAVDGDVALSLINDARKTVPDLILLDLGLPFIDGLSLLQLIRSSESWSKVPVIVISGSAEQGMPEKALSQGATFFLEKPVPPRALITKIRQLLPG